MAACKTLFTLKGNTALLIGYKKGHLELVRCLLAHQAGMETSDNQVT